MSSNRKSRTLDLIPGCDIEQKKCETSQKYKKSDIIELAEKCGIDIYDENNKIKSRQKLCLEIVEKERMRNIVNKTIENVIDMQPVNVPSNNLITEPVKTQVYYEESVLKRKKKSELLEITMHLHIDMWNDKPIKNQNKSDMIEAILDYNPPKSAVIPPILSPVVLETEIVLEDEPMSLNSLTDGKKLEGFLKNDLLLFANRLKISRWKNKPIKPQKKIDIIDAIKHHFKNIKASVVSKPQSPRKERQQPDINDLIRQKRLELVKVLRNKAAEICDPLNNINCSSNKVCNINKKPNTCISPEESDYIEGKGQSESIFYNNKKIIGSDKAIKTFRKMISEIESEGVEEKKNEWPLTLKKTKQLLCQICTYTNEPNSQECIVCQSELLDEDTVSGLMEGTEIIETIDNMKEGTEITDMASIEEILNEIQNADNVTAKNISSMDEAKSKILKCLGLLS